MEFWHGGSDITVPIRSERIANAIRSSGNSGVTVPIILGVSHSLLPNSFGPNRSWLICLPSQLRHNCWT
jgi:hypothetical protein